MGTVRTILKLFSISLGMCLSTIIIEGPKNAFVLLNSDAAFNCTVSKPWSVIIWIMNVTPVLTVVPIGPIITDLQFGEHNYTTQDSFTSELIIRAVTLKNNATVQCNIQTDGHQQADLFVQVAGTVYFESKISSVVINHSTDIVCKAESWNPHPTITWTINQTAVDSKMYTTTFQPASNHLYNALSTLNLTLRANAEVRCLATLKALPQPKTTELHITVKPHEFHNIEDTNLSELVFITHSPLLELIAGVQQLFANLLTNLGSQNGGYLWVNIEASQDRSWLIVAIVVPIIGFILLLIIIIIIIVVCCIKRNKHSESSYQNELRKISRRKSLEATGNDPKNSGLENFGMSTESVNDCQLSPSPSPHQVDSWFWRKSNNSLEMPAVPASNHGSQKVVINQYMVNMPTYPRKTRHVTAV